jgi:hypothetical protein
VYWGGEFTAVPIYSDRSGLMTFPMELDGKADETSFATGTRFSMLDSYVTRRFFGFDEASDGVDRETLPGGREVSVRRGGDLLQPRRPRCAVRDCGCQRPVCGRAGGLWPELAGRCPERPP